jgi:hypothetical protein
MNLQQSQVPRCASRYDFVAGVRASLFTFNKLYITTTLSRDDMVVRDSQT